MAVGRAEAVPATMPAYRLLEWGSQVELVELPVPTPEGRQVLVEVEAVGLCHSDLFVMGCAEGVLPYDLPMTLGHEVAGRVVAVGPDADPSLVGRSGVVHGVWSCGECHNCRRGHDNHCLALQGRVGCGLGRDGGLASHVLVPDARHFVEAHDVPPTALAPLADAGLTVQHAIRTHRDALVGDCAALVIGVGGLGHLAVQVLRATTSARVLAVDPRPEACSLAESLGAHHTSLSVDDALARLEASTGLPGVDVVLDFVGSDATIAHAMAALVPGGRVVVVGGARGTVVVGKGLELPLGWQVSAPFWGPREDLVAVVELAEKGLVDPVVEVVRFSEVRAAYDRLRDGGVTGRVVVVPDGPVG